MAFAETIFSNERKKILGMLIGFAGVVLLTSHGGDAQVSNDGVLQLLGQAAISTLSPRVGLAVLVLGLWNTFGAYLIHYALFAALGATRVSMVAYVIPVLGALFLNEVIDAWLLLGAALIGAGVALVSLNLAGYRGLFRSKGSKST